jgi:hypothetical protein
MEPIAYEDLDAVVGGNDMFKQAIAQFLGSFGNSLGGGLGQMITSLIGNAIQGGQQQGGQQQGGQDQMMAQAGQSQGQGQGGCPTCGQAMPQRQAA